MSETEAGVPPIPDHVPLRRVGRGSYGEVWLARSVTGAYRAVKIVHRRGFSSDRPYDREFQGILKFEPISRTHPGLVSILHVGRNDELSCFYYVMEVADDLERGNQIDPELYVPQTLGARLKQGRLPVAECIRVGLALTDALGHLHASNLIHRDIKPSNIIFTNGLPKLADIGLVTDIGEKATFVGTEGYIPPEGPGSPSADLYSLGKVLYETSTGQTCEAFPELPDHLRQDPDAALFARFNAVVMKACDGRVAHRFGSARQMHEHLSALGATGCGEVPEGLGRFEGQEEAAGPRVVVLFSPEDGRDARLACVLEERLGEAGCRVLLADSSEFGVTWARQIEREIRVANAVVLLLSDRSTRDEVLNYQLGVAVHAAGSDGKGPKVLSVRVAFGGGMPVPLICGPGAAQVLGWMDEADDDRLVGDLLMRIVGSRGRTGEENL